MQDRAGSECGERAEALVGVYNSAYHFKRIGLEAGPLSQWLFSALAEAGLPVICVETRHMRAVLKAQINKTDRNDARGIAQMMRAGLYRPVHVKTLRSQKQRMLLTHRKLLQSKAIAIDNDLRALAPSASRSRAMNIRGTRSARAASGGSPCRPARATRRPRRSCNVHDMAAPRHGDGVDRAPDCQPLHAMSRCSKPRECSRLKCRQMTPRRLTGFAVPLSPYSTSSTLSGPPPKAFCAKAACMNWSRSPSSTPPVSEVCTPVRRSFTI